MTIRALAALAATTCLVSCSTSVQPTSDSTAGVAPSAVPSAPEPAASTGAATTASTTGVPRADVIVNMHDNCDPDTFNAAVGPGACARNGGMKFDQFIAKLTQLTFVGPWQFAPKVVNARVGQEFLVINRGGEVHTFTEVEEFGGGIVPNLNALAQLPSVAPECLSLAPGDFVAAGQRYVEDIDEEGDEKYQCCIHPWMRLTAHVTERSHGH